MYAPLVWDDLAMSLAALEEDATKFVKGAGSDNTFSGNTTSHAALLRQELPPHWWLRDRQTVSELVGSVQSEIHQSKRSKRQNEDTPSSDYT